MDSPPNSLASKWPQKVMILKERAQVFCDRFIFLFPIIIQKIIQAGNALFVAIRSIEGERLKESMDIFQNMFTWLLGIIFTLKYTENGGAFFADNYGVMVALVLTKFLSFLTTLFGTLSQMHTRNLLPLIAMLLFESGVSLLALSMISETVLWIGLILWLCIFVLFGYYCYAELQELVLQIKRQISNHNPQGPPSNGNDV